MNEQRYQAWWLLHRRAAKGETLSAEEQRDYEAGRAELEAEEWASLKMAPADLNASRQPKRKRLDTMSSIPIGTLCRFTYAKMK